MIGNAAVLFWSRAPSSPVLGAVIVAVANFPLAVAPLSEALAIGCLVICGVGMGLFFPSFQASLQVAAEPAMQGRVSAIFFAANFGTDPIAALIVTAVVAFAGVSLGFGFAAAGGLAAALAVASQLNDRSEVDGDGQLARV